MSNATCIARFPMGRLLITSGASAALCSDDVLEALARHLCGDWGNVCPQDRKYNDEALEYGFRLLSSYEAHDGTKFWIITEHDRSVTTILLPKEY